MGRPQRIAIVLSLLFVLVAGACAAPAAPGAGSQTGGAEDAVSSESGGLSGELVMWRFPLMDDQEAEEASWDQVIERFNEQHPNVSISIETQPWSDRRQKLLSAIGSGRGPDVFYINPDMIPLFADNGAIIPISPYVSEEDLAIYNPGTLIEWKGDLWALPILQNAPLFIYNLDLVESIGLDPENLPTTVDEFIEWAEVAKENDLYISTWTGSSATAGLTEIIWKFGAEIFDEEGNVVIDSPEAVEAFAFIRDMYQGGYFPPDSITAGGEDQAALFRQGKALAIRTDGNRFYGSQETYVDNFEWAFGPVLTKERQVTNGTVGSYAISNNSENPEAAAEWIKHVTRPENSVLLNKTFGYLPPLQDAAREYEGESGIQILLDRAQYVQTDPVFPVASQAYIILAEEQQAVMTGDKTPEEAVASAQERIENAKAQLE